VTISLELGPLAADDAGALLDVLGGTPLEVRGRLAAVAPKVARLLEASEPDLLAVCELPQEHWSKLRSTDERFKAGVALSAGWDGVSLLGGRGRPRSKEQGRGAGSPAAQLALEGLTVAPQWWRPRPLRSGGHWGLVAGRLGCQPATSWR